MNRIDRALEAATDTKYFELGTDILGRTPDLFEHISGDRPALVVADANTFRAAGKFVLGHLSAAQVPCVEPYLFDVPPHADDVMLAAVRHAIEQHDAIAVAVGSGTINDLCKRASHEARRPYMVVATAASVDGYASFGAPISERGFKKTLPCAAPRAILADMDVLKKAPYAMTAAGYADLAAKVTGGADWIIADLLGVDPIKSAIWEMTQTPLRDWIADPQGLYDECHGENSELRTQNSELRALYGLFEGLTLTGFAMQATQSSRPASGAEHLFSHVWEMGHHTHDGEEPSHGFKVAIGTLATTRFIEALFEHDFTYRDIDGALARYPSWDERETAIRALFDGGELLDRILAESKAKHLSRGDLHDRLDLLAKCWTPLRAKLRQHLIPFARLRAMFASAGCPTSPADIGLAPQRVAATALAAQMIRSRYTCLDLAFETGLLLPAAHSLMTAF